MDRPHLRRRLAKLNEPLFISLTLKALSLTSKGEEFVLAVIHADDPSWRPLLDKLAPGREQKRLNGGQGDRFSIGVVDTGFLDFLVALFPESEAGIRAPAPDGYVRVFVLAYGGIDLFHVRYVSPGASADVS